MKLRHWQSECIALALDHYASNKSHFLCLATPGAGKTVMASMVAKHLLSNDSIDLVICVSPSVIVSDDFQTELEHQVGKRFDGSLGSIGRSLTYQAMINLGDDFWALFSEYRVFVIFDEIHHCAGSHSGNSNAWGEKIISEIQGRATYTLALTGTPWRSDSIPISLAHYCDNGLIHCDYSYGLSQAVTDNVCRTPSITLIDNNKITLSSSAKSSSYNSFKEYLLPLENSYQSLVDSNHLITYTLKIANKKLNILRKTVPNAGGLIVAYSIAHATQIHHILTTEFNETADIATYMEDDATSIIKQYKHSNTKWIISVGMISEGTNIPRLQVCCHLTRVKTELYFRQILGRILRADNNPSSRGYLYIPAEPTLVEYAYRVAEDIPLDNLVNFDTAPGMSIGAKTSPEPTEPSIEPAEVTLSISAFGHSRSPTDESPNLAHAYEATLGLFGAFKQKLLVVDGLSAG